MGKKSTKGIRQVKPTCVFCGAESVTEEHVWPDWLKQVVPKSGPDKTYINQTVNTKPLGYDIKQFIKQGHPSRYTVKRFCGKCNNEWMSQIEELTKPLLIPLILDHPIVLTKDAKWQIAIWASLRAIVCDYAATDIRVIREDRRISFYQKPKPLDRIFIWLSKASDGEESYNHYTRFSTIKSNLYRTPETSNTKMFLLVVGKLIVHILIYNQLYFPYYFGESIEKKVIQIWPRNNWGENWADLEPLTINERKRLLPIFVEYLNENQVALNPNLGNRGDLQ